MRIKELFTVPEGEKITDKMFSKVLLSSIVSILLSMACLFGTTWAWFTVTVENTENVIQIATIATDVTVTKDSTLVAESENGDYLLDAGTYEVSFQLRGDRMGTNRTVYVLVEMGEGEQAQHYYVAFENGTAQTRQLAVPQDGTKVSFCVSWVKPAAAQPAEALIGTIAEAPEETEPEISTPEVPTEAPEA